MNHPEPVDQAAVDTTVEQQDTIEYQLAQIHDQMLQAAQTGQPLDPEALDLLYDNRWDLYDSD